MKSNTKVIDIADNNDNLYMDNESVSEHDNVFESEEEDLLSENSYENSEDNSVEENEDDAENEVEAEDEDENDEFENEDNAKDEEADEDDSGINQDGGRGKNNEEYEIESVSDGMVAGLGLDPMFLVLEHYFVSKKGNSMVEILEEIKDHLAYLVKAHKDANK